MYNKNLRLHKILYKSVFCIIWNISKNHKHGVEQSEFVIITKKNKTRKTFSQITK